GESRSWRRREFSLASILQDRTPKGKGCCTPSTRSFCVAPNTMGELLRSSGSFDEWDRKEGTPGPMGVTWVPSLEAWNFALYSRRATGVTLLLYAAEDPVRPIFEERLNPAINKSGRIWHCWVPADRVHGAALYAYRVEGQIGRAHV